MKRNLITTAIIAVVMFLVMGTSSAYAFVQCAEATIVRVAVKDTPPSAEGSQYFVLVTCPSRFGDQRGYYLTSNLGDSGYATLLTAVSLGQTVLINLVDSYNWNSLIEEVQLNAPTAP